jgi:hypothetical protein
MLSVFIVESVKSQFGCLYKQIDVIIHSDFLERRILYVD